MYQALIGLPFTGKLYLKYNAIRALTVLVICLLIAGGLVSLSYHSSSLLFGYPTLLVCTAIAFTLQWLVFVPSYLLQTERYYDITGTATFVLVSACALYSVAQPTIYQWLLGSMVVIWALRLGSFLFLRIHNDGKDDRFDEIKKDKYRFFVTWTVQGLWVLITSGAAITAIISANKAEFGWMSALGCLIWLCGFSIEVIADSQKRKFKREKHNAQPFISDGLWHYSRHPNYFGEIVLWVGVALVALPALSGWQYLVLTSPLFVVVLLTKISGIPMLEAKANKKWSDNKAYQAYKARTPALIPKLK